MRLLGWKPSWLMLSVAGAVALISIALVAAMPIEQFHKLMAFAIGRDRFGQYTVFDRSIRYRKTPAPADTYRIAYVGGSTTRDTLWSEEFAEHALEGRMRARVEVFDLASSGQHNLSSWALAETAACRDRADIVVLGISLGRSSQKDPSGEPHILFDPDPPALSAFLKAGSFNADSSAILPVGGALRFRANVLYLSARQLLLDLIATGTVGAHAHAPMTEMVWHMLGPPPGREALLDNFRMAVEVHASNPPETYARNWDIWDGTVRAIEACGAKPILLQVPVNPLLSADGPYADANRRHLALTQKFAERTGVTIIDTNQMANYQPSDFSDFGHLGNPQSIQRTTGLIARRLADFVIEQGLSPRSRTR